MAKSLEAIRKTSTFFLAAFLWLHALLFLDIHSPFLARCTRLLHLTSSEVVLFALLFVFSFLTASGFWRTLLSALYVYFFPFVVLVYALVLCFRMLRLMNRWLKTQATPPNLLVAAPKVEMKAGPGSVPIADVEVTSPRQEFLRFILRPFRRFTLLWCVLLVVTTHTPIVWLCLTVVLIQLARQIFIMLQLMVFSPWIGGVLSRAGSALITPINNALAALDSVTRDTNPTNELRSLLNQLNIWRKILEFLADRYLVSRWMWVLGTVFLFAVYTYIAGLFSFAYYGIARVSGVSSRWIDIFVTSLFIPFFFSDLPKILAIRLLSGLQCALVVGVGVGTIVNFLRRRLDAVQRAAADLRARFADESVREKYLILEEKVSAAGASSAPVADTGK